MAEYPKKVAHGIMFHHFHGGRHPRGQGSISGEQFDELLQFVGMDRILDPAAWLEALREGRLEPDDLCLTFDDALLCQVEIALPVLERHGLRAFWFVQSCVFEGQPSKFEIYRAFRISQFNAVDDFYNGFFRKIAASPFGERAASVLDDAEISRRRAQFPFYSVNDVKYRLIRDRALTPAEFEEVQDAMIEESGLTLTELARNLWMTEEHLRELSRCGHHVGLHSYTHPMTMGKMSFDAQAQEYGRNFNHLRQVCGCEPSAMAHPAGSYSHATLDILRRLGIACGFRSSMAIPGGASRLNPSPLEIAREDHSNIISSIEGLKGSV